jgi:hypothetical protein
MFKRIALFLLTIVFIYSCNGQSFREVADPSVRIDIRGASVLPPQGKTWKIIQKNENRLILIKGNPQSDATYTASRILNQKSSSQKKYPRSFYLRIIVIDSQLKKKKGKYLVAEKIIAGHIT